MRGLNALPSPLPHFGGAQVLHLLLLVLLNLSTTAAQFCTGTETFEKVGGGDEKNQIELLLMLQRVDVDVAKSQVTGVELASASRTPLYSAVVFSQHIFD